MTKLLKLVIFSCIILKSKNLILGFKITHQLFLSLRRLKKYIQHELIHWPTPQHSDDKSIGIVFWKK